MKEVMSSAIDWELRTPHRQRKNLHRTRAENVITDARAHSDFYQVTKLDRRPLEKPLPSQSSTQQKIHGLKKLSCCSQGCEMTEPLTLPVGDNSVLGAVRRIKRFVDLGDSINVARNKVVKGKAQREFMRQIVSHPEYVEMLNAYMRNIGRFTEYYHDGHRLRFKEKTKVEAES